MGPMNLKPQARRSLGKGLGLGGLGGHVLVVPTKGLVARELPDVTVEGTELFLDIQEALGVVDDGLDFASVADNARVGHQALDVGVGVGGDLLGVEAGEGFAEVLPLVEDGLPGEAGLHTLQAEELELLAVVVDGDAPLVVVVGHHQGSSGEPKQRVRVSSGMWGLRGGVG